MNNERKLIEEQRQEAIRTVDAISQERKIKGNANVTAGRYGELVANMVKYAESQMALSLLEQKAETQTLPSQKHVEPESLREQTVINPS